MTNREESPANSFEHARGPAGRSLSCANLEIRDLVKAFGSVQAVDGLELTLEAGELRGLVGANGAGKTTTIACTCGLLRPDRGEIRICGVDVASRGREARARLGVAGQRTALYGALTVRANLQFFARLVDSDWSASERQVSAIAEALRLGLLMDRQVVGLSVGQQRLVHVASALAHRSRVLLLDEPTAGLDLRARADLLALLTARAEEGTAVLLSTHHLQEVEEHCATVSILHRGRIIETGAIPDLVGRHGAARVEIATAGRTVVRSGEDVLAALASMPADAAIDSVKVIRPSLRAVFGALTELHMGNTGELEG